MADILAIGIEPGDLTEFDATNNTPVASTNYPHCGTYSLECNQSNEYAEVNFSDTDEIYFRFYIRLSSLPPSDKTYYGRVAHLRGGVGSDCIVHVIFVRKGGELFVKLDCHYPWVNLSNSVEYEAEKYYCIDVYFKRHASAGVYRFWVNENLVGEWTGDNSASPQADTLQFGSVGVTSGWTLTTNIDCIVAKTTGPIFSHDQEFDEDAELGDFSRWDATEDNPTFSILKRHCGSQSILCDVVQWGVEGPYIDLGHHKEAWFMIEVQFGVLPETGEYVEFIRFDQDTTGILRLRIENDSGTIKWGFEYRAAGSLTKTLSAVSTNPVVDTWYCVKAKIFLSHEDGQAVGIYQMWIDGVELNDITQTVTDTDYTTFNMFRLRLTTDDASAILYSDCIEFDTVDMGSCHVEGSEDVPSLAGETDCVPDVSKGVGVLQVWQNCVQIRDIIDVEVNEESRGITVLTLPYRVLASRGDLFHVYNEGHLLLQGKAVAITKNRKKGHRIIRCQNKTARLYGRYILEQIHRSFEGTDVGEAAADLIDFYFDGLFTSTKIDTEIGIVMSDADFWEMSVGSAFETLETRGGAATYIDEDNIVHFFVEGSEDSGVIILQKDVDDCIVQDIGEKINRVIVKGNAVEASSGTGIPEHVVSDRRILTNEEAQEVADQWKDYFGSKRLVQVSINKFKYAKYGQSVFVDAPDDEVYAETLVNKSAHWKFGRDTRTTTFHLGTQVPTFKFMLRQIQKQIKEQQINRISGHVGTETAEADPTLLYTDLLSLGAGGAITIDQNSWVTIRTGTCASESDAATLCFVKIVVARDSGDGHVAVTLEDSGEVYRTWHIHPSANVTSYTLTTWIRKDMSGIELFVKARMPWADTMDVTATLLVRQIQQHAHSMSHSEDHDFD